MIHSKIEAADAALIDKAAREAGELATRCSDVGGQITAVVTSIRDQVMVIGELQSVMSSLESDQRHVTDATDEARLLSETARNRLSDGADVVAKSISEIAGLTALVGRLGAQITSFATALEQVRRTTEVIDSIARTTNMLALNAAIEAERAGDAGRSFAVVAAEVKALARNTRAATDEIAETMGSLTREAEAFVGDVGKGVELSRAAEHGFARVNTTFMEVAELVEQVDHQTDDIARATSLIHTSVCKVGDELDGFANAARGNDVRLGDAHDKMVGLEARANGLFDTIVHSGFAIEDRRLVDIALAERDTMLALTERALAEGKVTIEDLFDTNYRLIPGSNPERHDNRANDFADKYWRPELDRIVNRDRAIVSNACTDINGYLPTHTTKYSRPPNGDPVHDAAHCRNRRILADETDLLAKASTKPFHIAVYRRERDDGGYDVVRNVYVPLMINGRRWGDYEIAYRIDS